MLVLISGPLYSLVLMATYLKGFVLLEIFIIILANFLVLKYLMYKGKPFPEIKLLYGESQKKGISVQAKQKGEEETQSMFFTAIFTAWISPSSVWANNFQCKSYFLLVTISSTFYNKLFYLKIFCNSVYTIDTFISGNWKGNRPKNCKMLSKIAAVVNFTNILRAAFASISFQQKITKPK